MRIRQGPIPGSVADGITRGVIRLIGDMGFDPMTEFKLNYTTRHDLSALNRDHRVRLI